MLYHYNMPYKDKETLLKYQREWTAKRRKEWFENNGPCNKCGSWDNLELDHKDPKSKVSHKIWNWSESRRLAELVKCQILCRVCHIEKSKEEIFPEHGKASRYRNHKCRCNKCTRANTLAQQEYRRSLSLMVEH